MNKVNKYHDLFRELNFEREGKPKKNNSSPADSKIFSTVNKIFLVKSKKYSLIFKEIKR